MNRKWGMVVCLMGWSKNWEKMILLHSELHIKEFITFAPTCLPRFP